MRPDGSFLRIELILLTLIILWAASSQTQERPTILAGHGTLSASILPLWVGADARLFEKHGLQVRPIYLPRAAGRPALLSGDIQVYFSAGPPLVQMRLSGGDVAVTSCVAHKLTSKIMVIPSIQKIADLRGKVLAVANPGSASDFASKLFLARQGMKPGQDVSIIYSGSTSAAFAALMNGRVQAIFATSPNDLQAAQAGFKPLLELGDLNIPYAGNCTAVMRPYIVKQPARMRGFVAGDNGVRRAYSTTAQRSQGDLAEVHPGLGSGDSATCLRFRHSIHGAGALPDRRRHENDLGSVRRFRPARRDVSRRVYRRPIHEAAHRRWFREAALSRRSSGTLKSD